MTLLSLGVLHACPEGPLPLNSGTWVVLYIRVPFKVLFTRVPYYLGDPKRDPISLEEYPLIYIYIYIYIYCIIIWASSLN